MCFFVCRTKLIERMDRRLPPLRSSTESNSSHESGDRTVGDRMSLNSNRPWASFNYGPGLRKDSPQPQTTGTATRSLSAIRSSSPSVQSTILSSLGLPPSFGTMDTTTTIDGSKGSLSGGVSSFDRYRSLRLQSNNNNNNANSALNEVEARAAVKSSSAPTNVPQTRSPTATNPPSLSPTSSTTLRSSSPRDLRKQRLQQQFGKNSPYRDQQLQFTEATGQSSSSDLRNEEATTNANNTALTTDCDESSDKKSRKSKKSSSRTKSPEDLGEDGASTYKQRSSGRKPRDPVVVSQADDDDTKSDGTMPSPRKLDMDSDDHSTKKKKKKSKSSSRRRSSNKESTGSEDDDATTDDLKMPPPATEVPATEVPAKIPSTSSATEEISMQAALTKLAQGAPSNESKANIHKALPHDHSDSTAESRLLELQQKSSLESTKRGTPSSSFTPSLAASLPKAFNSFHLPTNLFSSPGPAHIVPATPPQSQHPKDEKPNTTNFATRGWSTYRNKPLGVGERSTTSNPFVSKSVSEQSKVGETSKVSQYLNLRKSATTASTSLVKETAAGALDKSSTLSIGAGAAGEKEGTYSNVPELGFNISETTDEDDEKDEESSSSSEEEEEEEELDGDAASTPEWSVRVCVVSAIDLPPSVVPTVPFSPVLKVGLVCLKRKSKPSPEGEPASLDTKANDAKDMEQVAQANLKNAIHSSGLMSVSRARVRSTTAKIMSKRDNGSVEFHEEMRWDSTQSPEQMALAIELSARAVMIPANHKESPFEQVVKPLDFQGAGRTNKDSSGPSAGSGDASRAGRLNALFRRGAHPSSEMDMALAASAVAKHLVEGEDGKDGKAEEEHEPGADGRPPNSRNQSSSEIDAKLVCKEKKRKARMTEDIRLGSQIIPLSRLDWRKALKNNDAVRLEHWFELETAAGGSPGTKVGVKSARNPSVLLEISFSSPDILDESEDDIEEEVNEARSRDPRRNASFARRASITIRGQLRKEVQMEEVKQKEEEPYLEPGVIDYICVVGARDIGDQKSDTGASGWVNSTPMSGILEQFPPSAEFHARNGRNVILPDKIDWFCFPEGVRLWRGTTPPNSDELNLVRSSSYSQAIMATTRSSFDASLRCTTSFSWAVFASNSDEYGSASTKTYAACIRFFVPAPTGIDPTQDDFGQSIRGASAVDKVSKRLWVPIAVCMTSQLPIVGAMEVMLLRCCEALSSMTGPADRHRFLEDIASLVINYQRPIPGVVSCCLPFLHGEPLTLALPPLGGLPPLPHGSSITLVCRLLGANGINYFLAALFTECKILIHSHDVTSLAMVAEVMTALMYPFQWALPYIPVLPLAMMEFIEAPLSYLLGVPTSSLKLVKPSVLDDVVVIDLDKDYSGSTALGDDLFRSKNMRSKTPTPLPASTAANIQKAVYRLLQHNDDHDSRGNVSSSRSFSRIDGESQVEREFRIAVSLEVAGLVKGYQDCLTMGPSNQPMFNVDKFLQSAPILFDEQRGTALASPAVLNVLSPRSRRFISILVTCQHFHQFLEVSESESMAFFREVMAELEAYGSKRDVMAAKRVLSLDAQKTIDQLNSSLKRVEDKGTTYRVKKSVGDPNMLSPDDPEVADFDFPYNFLRPIFMGDEKSPDNKRAQGVHQISLEHLVELEKNPWRYQNLLNIQLASFVAVTDKVKLREAIGERRYNFWKSASSGRARWSLFDRGDDDDTSVSDELSANQSLDWTDLLDGEESLMSESAGPTEEDSSGDTKRRISDAKDRDLLRRCLQQARVAGGAAVESTSDYGRDLISEAETALRNQSARRFLLAILKKRGSNEPPDNRSKRRLISGASKLEPGAFEALLRLACAMLDACLEDRDYDSAYVLLKLTAGLYSMVESGEGSTMLYMTQRLGHHPIYADLGVWLRAKKLHLNAGAENKDGPSAGDDRETDEYEAAVATLYEMLGYGIPAEELARFASRVSEENGWFRSERGQSLLLLARRICMRRDTGAASSSQKTRSDIELMSPTTAIRSRTGSDAAGEEHDAEKPDFSEDTESWVEIGWVHPSAQYSSRFEKDVKRKPNPTGHGESSRIRHMKRSAVTSMAYLGSSVVVTGALDGGVFMARNAYDPDDEERVAVKGIHLDWGSAGSRYTVQSPSTATDGAYGVGAVSVLAATMPANQSYDALQMKPNPSRKSVTDPFDEDELLAAMEGCRVVAGTTCGDLRVWSVKDVLSAVFYTTRGSDTGHIAGGDDRITHRGGEGASSSVLSSRRRTGVDFAAGSSLTRLKFSLRGRALSGHRGGVSCVDVPSHVYRPDSIITGGADGLIKLWSLRSPGSGTRRGELEPALRGSVNAATEQLSPKSQASRTGDAMTILSGHGGRILCVNTAWHGDRLLSGGADRTVRLWDLAGSGGKCLNSLSGHFGWVTSVKYWGPNTIISASTDRSIALWDARVRNAPLFTLRHHYAPISDILVGARTDPIMISAGGDGTIAAWDFRRLSDVNSQSQSSQHRQCKVIRRPAAKLYLHDFSSRRRTYGPVLLSRGPSSKSKTVCCLGRDAIIREWDVGSGEVVSEHVTGHCDTVSTFASLEGDRLHETHLENSSNQAITGTITTSWDGTVRVRQVEKAEKLASLRGP